MSPALADHLGAARRRAFVGRHPELAVIESALARPDTGAVVYIHGPGGVGKSTLLRQIAWLGERAGRRVQWRDGREPVADGIGATTPGPGLLLLVDSAEALGAPEAWLTEELLATVAADAIAVVAGRESPPLRWRTDPGWRDLVRVIALGNLNAEEGAELLTALGVPPGRHAAVLAYTRGHPLAMAIAADVAASDDGRIAFAAAPQVVSALLAGLLDAVPGAAHRAALEACAQVRVTTEPLLAALTGVADARELFDWLRTLSVIEFGPRGLFPHGLARDALTAELRWRHPQRYAEIHRRAGAYYQSQFVAADARSQQEILADFAYLHRDNATLGPFLRPLSATSATDEGLTARAGADADHDWVIELIRRHEGPGSAAIAGHWLRRRPTSLTVIQTVDGTPAGCYLQVTLQDVAADDRAADPAVDRAATLLARTAPLRSEETATMVRFWLSDTDYQDLSPVATAITLHVVRQYLTTPNLAVSLVAYADPEFWSAATRYLDFARLPAADFTVDGREFAVFGHDWRVAPTLTWLDLLASRETAAQPLEVTPPAAAPRLRVLDFDEFSHAVRVALRDLGRPDRLRGCALAQSRLVAARDVTAGPTARGAAVQALIREAADALAESPRDRRAYRAVHHTYLQPAGSQQRAADLLNLPMSTFRRHLAAGIRRLTELLWQRELSG
jgi:hypothetical protein